LFGLWVQSDIARYLGAVWLLISVGTIVWSLFTAGKVILGLPTILVFLSGALSLIASYMLFSKRFAAEFLHQQKTQPKYKGTLKSIHHCVDTGGHLCNFERRLSPLCRMISRSGWRESRSRSVHAMSALPPKADIRERSWQVR
jgi:hypothetical protein